jgi:hypothetical protein
VVDEAKAVMNSMLSTVSGGLLGSSPAEEPAPAPEAALPQAEEASPQTEEALPQADEAPSEKKKKRAAPSEKKKKKRAAPSEVYLLTHPYLGLPTVVLHCSYLAQRIY